MSRVSSTQIRAIVAAEVVSSIGSSMTLLALPWFVLVTTGSATKLGLVLGIGSIPFVTLPLPAGSLIARIGARRTMVIADAARLPLLAAIPALYSLDALSFPLLVLLVALTSVFTAAHMPAQRLILAEIVGDEESLVARVNAYLDGAQTTAPLVGPALAGVLIAALGPPNVLYVDAATFGVAAIVVGLFVPRRKPVAEAEERGLLAGVRYILRSRLLVVLCVSMLTMEFFFTLFVTTLPVFAFSDYDQNARIAGVFYAAMGAGALLGMPVVPVVVRRFGALHVAAAGFVLASIPKFLLGIPLPAAGVAAVLVLQGFVGPLTGAPIFTVITTRTPAALRTTVLSAAVGLMFLSGPLGPIAAGPLINAVGARTAFVIAAAGYLVGSAPFAIYVGRRRETDDPMALASDAELPEAPSSV
ncbi:MAG TPA: MFS transporter [Gaiellaceae bacterium]|nr:MFS transporter [Gaiellaceae bacterium]